MSNQITEDQNFENDDSENVTCIKDLNSTNLGTQFNYSKSLIYRKPKDNFNHQLYHHHRLHHHNLNQKFDYRPDHQCLIYSDLIQNKKSSKELKKKKKKKNYRKLKRKKNRFTKPPPDGGWGWIVVFASFLISLIADGISFSFGMIYVELIKYFGQSKSKTAWVGSLFFSMPLLAGPIASALTDRYGCRIVTIASGLIAAIGFLLSSFVQSLEFLYLTFSLTGIGLALSYVSGIVIVAHYFEKRRSLATGLAVCGTGIGTFVFPPLTNYFLYTYQWKNTLIIFGCFFLIIMICGFMIKDLNLEETDDSKNKENSIHKKKSKKNKKISFDESEVSNKLNDEESEINLRSENVQLIKSLDNIKNIQNFYGKDTTSDTKSNTLVNKKNNLSNSLNSSSEDSSSSSSESSSSESKSSSLSDLRTINEEDFNNENRFSNNFESPFCFQCNDYLDSDLNMLTSCNDLTKTFLSNLVRSNSAICLPTYLNEMHTSLKSSKACNIKEFNLASKNSLSSLKNSKLNNKTKDTFDFNSNQFHKDLLLNLQKKYYFYRLINIYPYLFPDCCREQKFDCYSNQKFLNENSNTSYFENSDDLKSNMNKNFLHSNNNNYAYDMSSKNYSSIYSDEIMNQKKMSLTKSNYKNVEMNSDQKLILSNKSFLKIIDSNTDDNDSPTTTTTTSNLIPPNNLKISLKTIPNKSVGQSLISSFVQFEPGTYFRHMKLKRDSISYRSAMLNTPRYRLKASSCPDIYRNSLMSLNDNLNKSNLASTLKYFLKDIFDVSLLKNFRFALFCISNSCLYACIDVPYFYMPEYAIQKGTSEKMASYLISVIGIVNTLGIVIVGYIGDKTWIKTSNLYSLFTTISGFSIFFLPVIQTYEGLVVLAAIYGFSISVNYTLITVILVDILTIEKFTTGYGFLLMVQGVSTLFGPPMAGWLFDISGSYNITFFVTGICIIFSGIIVIPVDNQDKFSWVLKRYNSSKKNDTLILNKKNGLSYNNLGTKTDNQEIDKSNNFLNA